MTNEDPHTANPSLAMPDASAAAAPGFPGASGEAHTQGWHLIDYVKVLERHRGKVGATFIAVLFTTIFYSFWTTPQYEAGVRLLIEPDDPNIITFAEVFDSNFTTAEYYETQVRLLQDRATARHTLDKLQLWDHPAFAGPASDQSFSLGRVFSWITQSVAAPPSSRKTELVGWRANAEDITRSLAIDRLLSNLRAESVRNSRLVDVKYRSPDPHLAAAVVSTYADSYIEQSLTLRSFASTEASAWLTEQLARQRQVVETSEAALHEYRQAHESLSLDEGEDVLFQRLSDLNAAVTRAKTELIEKEAASIQLEVVQNDPAALDTFPAIASSVFIQGLKREVAELERRRAELAGNIGPRHPDMVEVQSAISVATNRLRHEINNIVQSIRTEHLTAQATEAELRRELDVQKNATLAMDQAGVEYRVLQREADGNHQIYDSLLQRAKETSVSAQLRSSNIRIVEPAQAPRSPVSPRIAFNLLIGLLGGGLLGTGSAFFFEYLDDRIKTPDEVMTSIGLPPLGIIPSIPRKTLKTMTTPLINDGAPADVVESFKSLRSAVLFSRPDGRGTFCVTSTGPGEGKTSVASNLAVGFALAKQRVLIIDADLRRPTQHVVFDIDREPGLSDLLASKRKPTDALTKTSVPGLWVLPAGQSVDTPSELLGSKRFKEFLATLPRHFDWVFIDTPPVMAVTDASVIAHETTGVLFVVGAEMTSRHTAQRAVEKLITANAKFVGAILNNVNVVRNSLYYSEYYRPEYAAYYTEPAAPTASSRHGSTLQL